MNSIYKTVGTRKKLSDDRLEAAAKEYLATKPDKIIEGTAAELKALAEKELPEGPQTVAGVLAEIEKSYQGEAPFTAQRLSALNYYLFNGPAGEERAKNEAMFTVGLSQHGPEIQEQSIKGAYEMFHQYIDKAIDPLVKRIEAQKSAQ